MLFSKKIEKLFHSVFPAPFTIAVFLTFLTFTLALFTKNNEGVYNNIIEILSFWEKGIWNPPLLVFAIQMMLMLVLGHVLALTKPISNIALRDATAHSQTVSN